MAGNINALGIILIVLGTIFLVVRFGKKPKIKSIFVGIIIFFVFSFFMAIYTGFKCDHPNATFQWLIPVICLSILFIFRDNDEYEKYRMTWVAIAIIGSIALSHQFHTLVHSQSYTSYPDDTFYNMLAKVGFSASLEAEARRKNIIYPAGSLREVMKTNDNQKFLEKINRVRHFTIVSKLWHSSFTDLYKKSTGPEIDVWYPGGLLSEAADNIELREKKP